MARNRVWQMDLMDAHRAGRISDEELMRAARIGRTVTAVVHQCGVPVLTGFDGRVAALVATVDPYRLTAAGEVAAMRDDRRTYRLKWGALDRRDQFSIPGHPPAPDMPVLAEHRCGDPVPHSWRAPAPTPARTPAPTEEIPW